MNRRLSLSLLGVALMVLSGAAQAQCENMRVIVRNSVYSIVGLDAFCTEFNKMKADLAGMRSELTLAKRENLLLRQRLAGTSVRVDDDGKLAGLSPAQGHSGSRKRSQ